MSLIDFMIVTVKRNDCRIHFWGITRSEVVNRMINGDLSEKTGQL